MRKPFLQPLSSLVQAQLKPVMEKHGFTQSAIISQWDVIVGNEFALYTQPLKIAWGRQLKEGIAPHPATLHVLVETALLLEVQYQQALILERVNRFFGYKAVERLKLVQGTRDRPTQQVSKQASPALHHHIEEKVGKLNHSPLEEALNSLGRHIFAKNEK